MNMDIAKEVELLMKKNQRVVGGNFFTVPSPERYPFQWLWDSCFHSIIYRALNDATAAKHELLSVVRKQHRSGLIPHINFWHNTATPLPDWGREHRGKDLNHVFGVTGTSSLTQPPLLARTVRDVFKETNDKSFLADMLPSLISYFEYLHRERTTARSELLFIINPDESGEDNARRYDLSLGLQAESTADAHLTRRIQLMEQLALCDFNTKECMKRHFAVIDVGMNCIYADGLAAMVDLVEGINRPAQARTYQLRLDTLKQEMCQKLSIDQIHFFGKDIVSGLPLKTRDWNLFMPLYAGLVSKKAAEQLVTELFADETFFAPYGIRTLEKNNRAYEPNEGLWRGPVWIAPHYFLYQGLKRYSFTAEAAIIKKRTETLLEKSGFREHYNGETGEGFGAHNFTWGGLSLAMR